MKKLLLICLLSIGLSSYLIAEPSAICSLSTETIQPGDVLRVDIFSKVPITNSTIRLFKKNHYFLKENKGHPVLYRYYYYIGIPRNTKPGPHPLKVILKQNNTTLFDHVYTVNVKNKHFKKIRLAFSKQKSKIVNNRTQLKKEASKIRQKIAKFNRLRYFDQTAFIMPTNGRISSKFGAVRQYNGSYTRFHNGVDIANKVGTPIVAPQAGKVIFNAALKTHGQTLMIDHGLGIISIFNHMSRRLVKEGDFVKKGQEIGKMGATGMVTGPHLHWGISVKNVRVDPINWTKDHRLWR